MFRPNLLRNLLRLFFVVVLVGSCTANADPQRPPAPSNELNTLLFHATFRIQGPSKDNPNGTTFGTVFIMAVPPKDGGPIGQAVLITAAHVLDEIEGDTASLLVRKPEADGSYTAYLFNIPIRDGGRPLYVKHSEADVAAMWVDLPVVVPITGLTSDVLADDKKLQDIELHPGDEVYCLGFPLAASGPGGFPILRTGHIASYPITPLATVKQIELDIYLLPGNSGGPVYYSFSNRIFKNQVHLGLYQGLLGLVIQTEHSALPGLADKDLNFGVILPGPFIRQTIDLLPPKR